MTPSSETGATRTRRILTPAQKAKLVRTLKDRGERTLRAVAEECKVGVWTVYYWAAQLEKGVSLDAPLPEPSTATAITRSKPAAVDKPRRALKQTEMFATVEPAPERGPLTMSERDELLLLRAEVTRLRRMVAASMM